MEIPEEVLRIAEARGINVVDLIINAISRQDPTEGIKLRLDLAKKYLSEVNDYLSKGDAVQASEKAYKAAEEVVKALAEKFDLPEYREALSEGRWFTHLLSRAVNRLSRLVGDWVVDGWSSAYVLHVWGFHEAKLSISDLDAYLSRVRRMVEEGRKVISGQ